MGGHDRTRTGWAAPALVAGLALGFAGQVTAQTPTDPRPLPASVVVPPPEVYYGATRVTPEPAPPPLVDSQVVPATVRPLPVDPAPEALAESLRTAEERTRSLSAAAAGLLDKLAAAAEAVPSHARTAVPTAPPPPVVVIREADGRASAPAPAPAAAPGVTLPAEWLVALLGVAAGLGIASVTWVKAQFALLAAARPEPYAPLAADINVPVPAPVAFTPTPVPYTPVETRFEARHKVERLPEPAAFATPRQDTEAAPEPATMTLQGGYDAGPPPSPAEFFRVEHVRGNEQPTAEFRRAQVDKAAVAVMLQQNLALLAELSPTETPGADAPLAPAVGPSPSVRSRLGAVPA